MSPEPDRHGRWQPHYLAQSAPCQICCLRASQGAAERPPLAKHAAYARRVPATYEEPSQALQTLLRHTHTHTQRPLVNKRIDERLTKRRIARRLPCSALPCCVLLFSAGKSEGHLRKNRSYSKRPARCFTNLVECSEVSAGLVM
jgi:hypothetical protein